MSRKTYNIFFLDRDGVINANKFVNTVEDFEFLPKSLEAFQLLKRERKTVFIATNQGGIEAGYLTEETLQDIHDNMRGEILKTNGYIHEIYYCPHLDTECYDRKPNPGMIIKALEQYNLRDCTESECCFIGDHVTDWQAAVAAGINPIAVKSDRYWDQDAYRFMNEHKIPLYDNLYEAVFNHI